MLASLWNKPYSIICTFVSQQLNLDFDSFAISLAPSLHFFCENLKLFFPSSEQSQADLYVLEERRCLLLMIVVYGRFTLTLCVLYLFKWKNRKDHYCCKWKRTTSMESFMGIVEEAITWGHGNMIVLWFSMHQLDNYCLWKWWMSEDIIE